MVTCRQEFVWNETLVMESVENLEEYSGASPAVNATATSTSTTTTTSAHSFLMRVCVEARQNLSWRIGHGETNSKKKERMQSNVCDYY